VFEQAPLRRGNLEGAYVHRQYCYQKLPLLQRHARSVSARVERHHRGEQRRKTALLRALAHVFGRRGRSRPRVHDFSRPLQPSEVPPRITIAVTLRSSATNTNPDTDTDAERALVASWLTEMGSAWEAQLTYSFFLPEQHLEEFRIATAGADEATFLEALEGFLPKYVSRIYGGNPDTAVVADADSLSKFDCQFLDALRDAEAEMLSARTHCFVRCSASA